MRERKEGEEKKKRPGGLGKRSWTVLAIAPPDWSKREEKEMGGRRRSLGVCGLDREKGIGRRLLLG